jgi:hypothetical protein
VARLELHYRRTTWKPFNMHDDSLLGLGPHLMIWLDGCLEARSLRFGRCHWKNSTLNLSLN